MKLFFKAKDGGPESNVTGFWLIESKRFFSIALLRFSHGSRENYHNHAFNAISWVLTGKLLEYLRGPDRMVALRPSFKPVFTPRDRLHKVWSNNTTWAITFRGPWASKWQEYNTKTGFTTLTNGRKIVNENSNN